MLFFYIIWFVSRVLYAKRDYIKILLGNVLEEEQ